jgi:hypothetical protein
VPRARGGQDGECDGRGWETERGAGEGDRQMRAAPREIAQGAKRDGAERPRGRHVP